jgi:hypothetical protein
MKLFPVAQENAGSERDTAYKPIPNSEMSNARCLRMRVNVKMTGPPT